MCTQHHLSIVQYQGKNLITFIRISDEELAVEISAVGLASDFAVVSDDV
jgi:hypothetical protein